MEVFKIIGFVFISLCIIIILKSSKRDDMALFVTLISSAILLSYMFLKLDGIVSLLNRLIENSGINKSYLTVLLKVTGLSYIIELTSNICKDAGSTSLATKVEMIGKVSIVVLTIPILNSVIEVILQMV